MTSRSMPSGRGVTASAGGAGVCTAAADGAAGPGIGDRGQPGRTGGDRRTVPVTSLLRLRLTGLGPEQVVQDPRHHHRIGILQRDHLQLGVGRELVPREVEDHPVDLVDVGGRTRDEDGIGAAVDGDQHLGGDLGDVIRARGGHGTVGDPVDDPHRRSVDLRIDVGEEGDDLVHRNDVHGEEADLEAGLGAGLVELPDQVLDLGHVGRAGDEGERVRRAVGLDHRTLGAGAVGIDRLDAVLDIECPGVLEPDELDVAVGPFRGAVEGGEELFDQLEVHLAAAD